MKKILIFSAFTSLLFLTSCSASPTLGNVGIAGGAQNVSTNTIGKNEQLSYLSSAKLTEACDAQKKIITDAKWNPTEEPSVNDTYTRQSFSDGVAELTLMCSEEKEGDNYLGTKITLTLMKKSQ